MVESSDTGEVQGKLFIIIWPFGFQGEAVFAWLSRRMQVKSRGDFLESYGHSVLG